MTGKAKTTTDPETIRAWVETHGGRPARVRGTGDGDDPGILRIDVPGGAGEDSLEPISWEECFQKFQREQPRLPLSGREGERRGEHVLQARPARRRLTR
jgi:hypothetical protein